jgi:hypothetical protein
MLILIVLLSLYSSLWVENLKSWTMSVFKNKYFNFAMFMLVTFIASDNPALGVILAISILVTLQTITYSSLNNQIDAFSPSNFETVSNHLTKPLLKEKELGRMGTNLNLQLQTPNNVYEKMVKQGKVLLEDSQDLKQDLNTRFDAREQSIANITKRNGMVLVQSGLNRLQKSNNGEYNLLPDNKSLLTDDVSINNSSSYVKYDRFMENYSDNELIVDLYNLLKNKYNEITLNKSLTPIDFDIKLQEIYDTEFELLTAIAEIKCVKINTDKSDTIRKKIEHIKELRKNKKPTYYNELNSLSELLCT